MPWVILQLISLFTMKMKESIYNFSNTQTGEGNYRFSHAKEYLAKQRRLKAKKRQKSIVIALIGVVLAFVAILILTSANSDKEIAFRRVWSGELSISQIQYHFEQDLSRPILISNREMGTVDTIYSFEEYLETLGVDRHSTSNKMSYVQEEEQVQVPKQTDNSLATIVPEATEPKPTKQQLTPANSSKRVKIKNQKLAPPKIKQPQKEQAENDTSTEETKKQTVKLQPTNVSSPISKVETSPSSTTVKSPRRSMKRNPELDLPTESSAANNRKNSKQRANINHGKPLIIAEKMPRFPGGESKLQAFLASHIQYPKEALEKRITGRVFVQFIVTANGSIEKVKVIRGLGMGLDEEAIRVTQLMPKWEAASHYGEKVAVVYSMPVLFSLD